VCYYSFDFQNALVPQPGTKMISIQRHDSSQRLIFDRTSFVARCIGSQELVDRLIAVLLETLPEQRRSLQKAIENQVVADIGRISHRLQGTAKNVCADRLSHAASLLELACTSNDMASLQPAFANLYMQIDALIDELARGARRI